MANRGRQWHEGLSGLLPIRRTYPRHLALSLALVPNRIDHDIGDRRRSQVPSRLVEGVSLPNGVEPDVLLVDGQQRLTSPFQATTCGRVVSTMNIRKQPVKRWFYFDMRRALAGC